MLVLTSNNVLLPGEQHPLPALIKVDDKGRIIDVERRRADFTQHQNIDVTLMDLGDLYILPGLVDAHVHLNEPGRTDWEGFHTGTRAAVAGGFTTVVDMPLNSIPPTTTTSNLELKRKSAQRQCWSDVAFWGGVIPGNTEQLLPLIQDGVKGFKCFLIESGVNEFPHVTEDDVEEAMRVLEPTSSVLLFHAELDSNPSRANALVKLDSTDYSTFLNSRPDFLEAEAINLVIRCNRRYSNLRTHIVHLSSETAIPLIKEAKSAGLPLTVETCFHYLCLSSSDIPAGRPEFKCCPPIRSNENREKLWEALKEGTIDFVVSDHSPCVAELKCLQSGDIMKAWGGIGGLGIGLSLLWTEGRRRGISIGQIVEWLSLKPAIHANLIHVKGSIDVGKDADFVIFDPEAEFLVTSDILHFKNKISPYIGKTLSGRVKKTILRGQVVWDRSKSNDGFAGAPHGNLL